MPTPTPTAYTSVVLADSPLGFWPLDETPSDPVDAASTHDAVWAGYAAPIYGPAGCQNAADLAAGTYATLSADTSALYVPSSGSWSIEAWIRYTYTGTTIRTPVAWVRGTGTSPDADTTFISVNNGTGNAGIVEINVANAAGSARIYARSTSILNDGNWHHIVGTASSGGSMHIYVDGVLEATNAAGRYASTAAPQTRRVYLGSNSPHGGGGQLYKEDLSCVAIYNSALTSTQVLDHFNAMPQGPCIAGGWSVGFLKF